MITILSMGGNNLLLPSNFRLNAGWKKHRLFLVRAALMRRFPPRPEPAARLAGGFRTRIVRGFPTVSSIACGSSCPPASSAWLLAGANRRALTAESLVLSSRRKAQPMSRRQVYSCLEELNPNKSSAALPFVKIVNRQSYWKKEVFSS
jgi:hypothetical protein